MKCQSAVHCSINFAMPCIILLIKYKATIRRRKLLVVVRAKLGSAVTYIRPSGNKSKRSSRITRQKTRSSQRCDTKQCFEQQQRTQEFLQQKTTATEVHTALPVSKPTISIQKDNRTQAIWWREARCQILAKISQEILYSSRFFGGGWCAQCTGECYSIGFNAG